MDWRGSSLEMFSIDHDWAWVLQASENLGVEHGGREGPLAPLLEHFDQGVCK
jgi:hypothetical protein